MQETSRRVLAWMYEQDNKAEQKKYYSATILAQDLGLSDFECQVALSDLNGHFVNALKGDGKIQGVRLEPQGYAWGADERRRQILAADLFQKALKEAEVTRQEKLADLKRSLSSRGMLHSSMAVQGVQEIERAFIRNSVAARLQAEGETKSLTSENEIEQELVSFIEESIRVANTQQFGGRDRKIELNVDAVLEEERRNIRIACNRRSLGIEEGREPTTTRYETHISTGDHALITAHAQNVTQSQMNNPSTDGILAIIDRVIELTESTDLTDAQRRTTSEALADMKQEATISSPRKNFMLWCLEKIPPTIRLASDAIKLVELINKLHGQS